MYMYSHVHLHTVMVYSVVTESLSAVYLACTRPPVFFHVTCYRLATCHIHVSETAVLGVCV